MMPSNSSSVSSKERGRGEDASEELVIENWMSEDWEYERMTA
jgi:hypothetical protein